MTLQAQEREQDSNDKRAKQKRDSGNAVSEASGGGPWGVCSGTCRTAEG